MKCDLAKLDGLLKDARSLRTLYKLAPTEDGLAWDIDSEPAVDLTKMSARFTLSTPVSDRSGDEVSPAGCVLTNYKANPLVLWEHGFSQHGMLPIGKSEDEHGQLTVEVTPDALIGTCYYSQREAFAAQVFGLVAERIIRGASIRLKPLVYAQTGNGLVIESYDLEEWSNVGIPCNPEAVAKTVRDGKLRGEKLHESLMKSLSRWVPAPAARSRGWTPPVLEKRAMAKSKAKADDIPEDEEVVEGEEAVVEEEVVEEEMPKAAAKPGAAMLTSLGAAYKGMADALEEEMKNQENPTVLEYGAAALETLRKMCDECQGKLKEAYPDHQADEPEEGEEPVVKSVAHWVAKHYGTTGLQIRGLASGLAAVEKAVPKHLKPVVGRTIKALDAIAKGAKELVDAEKNKPLPESLTKAAADLDEKLKRVKDLIPAK